jgi:hypothetical protein
MKKLTFSLIAGLAIGLASCGSPSIEDVKLEDIKDAWGCSDAVKTVSEIMVAEAAKYDNDADKLKANADSKKLMDAGEEKIDAVMKKCRKDLDVDKEAIEKCSSFAEADKNMKALKDM